MIHLMKLRKSPKLIFIVQYTNLVFEYIRFYGF
jgi:hypothetical protein